jgi:hypothetical protein
MARIIGPTGVLFTLAKPLSVSNVQPVKLTTPTPVRDLPICRMRLDHPLLISISQESLAMEVREARTRVTETTLDSSGTQEVTRTETTTRIETMVGAGLTTRPEPLTIDPLSEIFWLT